LLDNVFARVAEAGWRGVNEVAGELLWAYVDSEYRTILPTAVQMYHALRVLSLNWLKESPPEGMGWISDIALLDDKGEVIMQLA